MTLRKKWSSSIAVAITAIVEWRVRARMYADAYERGRVSFALFQCQFPALLMPCKA